MIKKIRNFAGGSMSNPNLIRGSSSQTLGILYFKKQNSISLGKNR